MAIITLSREAFSGARELAELVARRLNYRVVSRDDIIHKLVEYGVPRGRLNRARRRQLGWLPRMVREWVHYVIFLRAALSQEILSGDLIYLGNNGQQILAGFPNTLHVGVIVGLSYRVGNLIKLNEYGIDPKTARRLIAKIDRRGRRGAGPSTTMAITGPPTTTWWWTRNTPVTPRCARSYVPLWSNRST